MDGQDSAMATAGPSQSGNAAPSEKVVVDDKMDTTEPVTPVVARANRFGVLKCNAVAYWWG